MFLCMRILISIRNIIMHGSMCDGTGEKILSSNRYFSITNPVFHKSGCTGTCICRCGYCNRKQHGCSDRKWWDRTHEGLSSGLSFSGAIEQKGDVEDQAEYIPGFSCVRFSYRNQVFRPSAIYRPNSGSALVSFSTICCRIGMSMLKRSAVRLSILFKMFLRRWDNIYSLQNI